MRGEMSDNDEIQAIINHMASLVTLPNTTVRMKQSEINEWKQQFAEVKANGLSKIDAIKFLHREGNMDLITIKALADMLWEDA